MDNVMQVGFLAKKCEYLQQFFLRRDKIKKIPDEGVRHRGTSVRGLGVNLAPNAIQKYIKYFKDKTMIKTVTLLKQLQ
jgi:hypothetical protein